MANALGGLGRCFEKLSPPGFPRGCRHVQHAGRQLRVAQAAVHSSGRPFTREPPFATNGEPQNRTKPGTNTETRTTLHPWRWLGRRRLQKRQHPRRTNQECDPDMSQKNSQPQPDTVPASPLVPRLGAVRYPDRSILKSLSASLFTPLRFFPFSFAASRAG